MNNESMNNSLVLLNLPSPQVAVRCGGVIADKKVEQAAVRPGEVLTYTIIITGVGDLGPTQLVVTDTLPSGVMWADSLTATPPAFFTNGVVTWTGVVSADTSVAIRYAVTASLALTNGTLITNVASFASETGPVYNTSPAKTRVIAPDLSPSRKIASRATIRPGEQMTYTLVLVNSGAADAVGSYMTDTLPADVSPVGDPVASTGSAGRAGQVITWTGTVFAARPVTITVPVSVSQSPVSNWLVNQAEVDDGLGRLTTVGPVTTSIVMSHLVYLPLGLKNFAVLPDLVVSAMAFEPPTVVASQPVTVYVHVTNVGNTSVQGPFWVDLYVDCDESRMPPGPNEIWPDLGCMYGVAWLVDDDHAPGVLPLEPGETVTLDSNRYPTEQIWSYWPGYFPAPSAIHVLYAKADAYNGDVPYSAVLEMDEDNNTLGPITVTVTGGFSLPMLSVPARPNLAPRPAPGAFSHP